MKVGYCVRVATNLASYRLRVAIPSQHLGCGHVIGNFGDVTFFYKHDYSDRELAESCGNVVYDVVNDHFSGRNGEHYRAMIGLASQVTCASEWMRDRIMQETGRDAIVIDDPYENEESEPGFGGDEVLWFGHRANLRSLVPYADIEKLIVVSNIPDVIQWSTDSERRALERCGVVLLTSDSPSASTNRIVKALRAGRFVVTPGGVPAWDEFAPYIWIGDVRDGIRWAFNNREEVCQKLVSGQEYVRARNSPEQIAAQWTAAFVSTWQQGTSDNRGGYQSTLTMDMLAD